MKKIILSALVIMFKNFHSKAFMTPIRGGAFQRIDRSELLQKKSGRYHITKKSKKDSFNDFSKKSTINQDKYWEMLQSNNKLIVAEGPAGTGKTFLSCKYALEQMTDKTNTFNKVVLTRPIVAVEDESIGFLPGTLDEKMLPWILPIVDVLKECGLTKDDVLRWIRTDKVEIVPFGFMRGRTFHNSIIIADEMQNSSPKQMEMLLTRIGRNSKCIVNGDLRQNDIDGVNGLFDLCHRIEKSNIKKVAKIEFTEKDVMRDPFVADVIKLYSVNPDFTDLLNPHLQQMLDNIITRELEDEYEELEEINDNPIKFV